MFRTSAVGGFFSFLQNYSKIIGATLQDNHVNSNSEAMYVLALDIT